MTTDQSYDHVVPKPNPVEPTVTYRGRISLNFPAGDRSRLLYWAFVSQKEDLYKQAAADLIENELGNYLQTMSDIGWINEILTNLFEQVNNQLSAIITHPDTVKRDSEFREQETAVLLEKIEAVKQSKL